jgi:SHS2 domain-containing protein
VAKDKFRFIDDIATADAAFEAFGDDLSALLIASAEALFSVIIDLESVKHRMSHSVTVESDSEEALLYDWLSELVYLKDRNRELYSLFEVSVAQKNGKFRLEATIHGEGADDLRDQTQTDVKAVTYHRLKIDRVGDQLRAFIVLDL